MRLTHMIRNYVPHNANVFRFLRASEAQGDSMFVTITFANDGLHIRFSPLHWAASEVKEVSSGRGIYAGSGRKNRGRGEAHA